MESSSDIKLSGGCHCGAVRWTVAVPKDLKMIDCNCSICTKKGHLHIIVPKERFSLETSEASLTIYQFNSKVAVHKFCSTCGIHSYYVPRSHPDGISVNARCVDGGIPSCFEVQKFDGANWEQNIETIR